jgi:hypothetical protein
MTDFEAAFPTSASEAILECWERGAKRSAHYLVDGARVGYRCWDEEGRLLMEYGLRDGLQHGLFRTWHDNGQLLERMWYERGKEHGTHEQYDADGNLIGTYTMVDGTGIDVWFGGPGILAEERQYQDGERHGFERWWNKDNQTVYEESHFWLGLLHGIVRRWNQAGRLRRGYPQYFVAGRRVSKRAYERSAHLDPTLPPFRREENLPARRLPDNEQQLATGR